MAHGLIGREYFRQQLRYHKIRFARARKNKRAYNKIIEKCEFFERNAQAFGVAVIFNRKKRSFTYIKIKEEEEIPQVFVSVPCNYLPKLPSPHAEQA